MRDEAELLVLVVDPALFAPCQQKALTTAETALIEEAYSPRLMHGQSSPRPCFRYW